MPNPIDNRITMRGNLYRRATNAGIMEITAFEKDFCGAVPDQGCAGPVAYNPRGPFATDLQYLPLQRVQERQWWQKMY